MILAARSPVFAAMFKNEMLEKQIGIVTIPDCDPDMFQEFLNYLYSGKVENISLRKTRHLYKIADKYNVNELSRFCVEHMKENLDSNNICDFAAFAEEYDFMDLLAIAHDFFNKNIGDIFVTTEWREFLTEDLSLANKFLLHMASYVKSIENYLENSLLF